MAGKYRSLAVAAGMAVLAGVSHAFIQDPSILIDKALNSPVLTIKYKGASVALVELKVNGVSFNSRSVSPRETAGETNFTLDTSTLVDGDNVIEVCLYDSTGKLVGTQKTTVNANRPVESPVFLDGLKTGSTVTGPLEIKVGLRREFKNMYVSFFINDEFKTLKNFPPYSYLWDTSRMENGWYDLEAWIVDENNATFKTPKTRVYVNNPGGRTDRRDPQQKTDDPVDFDTDPKASNVKPAEQKATANVMLDPIWARVTQMSGTRAATIAPGIPTGPKSLTPTGTRTAEPVAASAPKPVASTTALLPSVTPQAPVAKAAKPVDVTSPVVVDTPKAIEPKTVAVQTPAPTPVVTPKPNPVPTAAVKTAASVAPVAINYGTRLPNMGTFKITYNSRPVEFDHVLPRVADGVPLTPFRYLFEQAGGTVDWKDAIKQVQAKGLGKTVVFRIGDKTATIDTVPYTLELAPFIDRGRSVIPLSFIRDSLDVDVQYDPATGHVLITTVEKTAKK